MPLPFLCHYEKIHGQKIKTEALLTMAEAYFLLLGSSFIDRTHDLRLSALMPGDIIITCDDVLFTSCRSFFYTGKSVIGEFEHSRKLEERSGEAAERFVESLFGCYVFAVLRLSLTMD